MLLEYHKAALQFEVNSVDLPVESTINYDETNIPVNKEDVDFNNIAYTHDDLVNGNTFDRSQILDTDWDQNLHQEKLPDGTSILYEIDDSGNRVDMGWTNSDSIGNTNDTGHGMSR